MPVISIIISKYLYHPQQKTRTRTTTKKWQKNIFHDHEKKERKNIDYVHVLEDVPIWWHDILLVIGIFAQQAINKDIISLFFWKTHGTYLLVIVMATSDSSVAWYHKFPHILVNEMGCGFKYCQNSLFIIIKRSSLVVGFDWVL